MVATLNPRIWGKREIPARRIFEQVLEVVVFDPD